LQQLGVVIVQLVVNEIWGSNTGLPEPTLIELVRGESLGTED